MKFVTLVRGDYVGLFTIAFICVKIVPHEIH